MESLKDLEVKHKELERQFTQMLKEHESLKESYESSKHFKHELETEKANHEKSIDILKIQQTKLQKLGDSNKAIKEEISSVKSDKSTLASKF
ncbi:hypothetical protein CANTEDRAFT_114591, partial [Yamadazyma tenuis ATCC 10573]